MARERFERGHLILAAQGPYHRSTIPERRETSPGCNAVSTARAMARVFAATVNSVNGVRLRNAQTLLRATRLPKRGKRPRLDGA